MSQTSKRRHDNKLADRYLALFDILGFKNRVENNDLPSVVRFIKGFLRLIRSQRVLLEGHVTLDGKDHPLGYKFFSDTILVYSEDTSFQSLHNLILVCLVLIREGVLEGIPLRGAITKGEVFIDKDIYVGKPIVQAYRMERQQQWIGCWVDDLCLEDLSAEEKWRLEGDMIVPYHIPLKARHDQSLWAVNWTVSIYIQGKQPIAFDRLDKIFSADSIDNEIAFDVEQKKHSTRCFLDYCFSNIRELLADKLVLR